jgi:hypothetical protein
VADRNITKNRMNIEPNVPTSKPCPKKERYLEVEKKEEMKKTTGIKRAKTISQKNMESVIPTESRNPLPVSRETGRYGIKKNADTANVNSSEKNDRLFKNLAFLDSMLFFTLSVSFTKFGLNLIISNNVYYRRIGE